MIDPINIQVGSYGLSSFKSNLESAFNILRHEFPGANVDMLENSMIDCKYLKDFKKDSYTSERKSNLNGVFNDSYIPAKYIPYPIVKNTMIHLVERYHAMRKINNDLMSKYKYVTSVKADQLRKGIPHLVLERNGSAVLNFNSPPEMEEYRQHIQYLQPGKGIDIPTKKQILLFVKKEESSKINRSWKYTNKVFAYREKTLISWEKPENMKGVYKDLPHYNIVNDFQQEASIELVSRMKKPIMANHSVSLRFRNSYSHEHIVLKASCQKAYQSNILFLLGSNGCGKTLTVCSALKTLSLFQDKMSFCILAPQKILNQWEYNVKKVELEDCKVHSHDSLISRNKPYNVLVIDEFHSCLLDEIEWKIKYDYVIFVSNSPDHFHHVQMQMRFPFSIQNVEPFITIVKYTPRLKTIVYPNFIQLKSKDHQKLKTARMGSCVEKMMLPLIDDTEFAKKALKEIDEKEEQCVICMEDFNQDDVCILTCGHKFHTCCIQECIKQTNQCPLCRSESQIVDLEVPPKIYHLVDLLSALSHEKTTVFVNSQKVAKYLKLLLDKVFTKMYCCLVDNNRRIPYEKILSLKSCIMIISVESEMFGVDLSSFQNAIFFSLLDINADCDSYEDKLRELALNRYKSVNGNVVRVFELIYKSTVEELFYHNLLDAYYSLKTKTMKQRVKELKDFIVIPEKDPYSSFVNKRKRTMDIPKIDVKKIKLM